MIIYIYLILFLFFSILSWCGVTIFRRASSENRLQVILSIGTIFGISFYIFLINLTAHLVKGGLGLEILLALMLKKSVKAVPLSFPKKRDYLLFYLSLLIFVPFLIAVSAQGPANTADSFMHYSLAAVFARGDYPPHVPWQPDYVSYYHLGVAEILGAMRILTSASYELLFTFLELILLICIAISLPWLHKSKKNKTF